jgi:hypothetical protein
MNNSARLLTVFSLLFALQSAQGEGFSKVGTTAAQFLKIEVGARAVGMGGAFVAQADDGTALYWNPAGLTRIDGIALSATHVRWLADLTHSFVGLGIPLRGQGALGLSATFLGSPETEITTVEEPDGIGEYFGYSSLAVGLSYARALTDRFSVGLTGKYIQENAFNESASTVALDVGTLLRTNFFGTRIGMCLSNFGGGMKLEGRDLIAKGDVDPNIPGNPDSEARLQTETWPLPMSFRVGAASDLVGTEDSPWFSRSHRATIAADATHPNDGPERINAGIEYSWRGLLALRTGYKFGYDEQSWTAGGGLSLGSPSRRIRFDYALGDFGVLQKVHRFSLGMAF